MKRIIFILILFICMPVYAGTITPHTVYSTTGQVTSATLNGNVNAILAESNGGLDNDNADTANGYRFVEVKGSEPAVGTEGRVIYLTTEDTLKFDNGSAWLSVVTPSTSPATNDMIYYNGTAWTNISPNDAAAGTVGMVPTGSMQMWLTDTAPNGWLLCYGQAVSRTTYANLFAVISDDYGVGNGSTTFNLPDLRGRLPLGQDDMGGSGANRITDTDADTLGGTDGDETKTIAEGNLPAHTHTLNRRHSDDVGATYGNVRTVSGAAEGTAATSSIGSGTALNVTGPFITVNYIIKI